MVERTMRNSIHVKNKLFLFCGVSNIISIVERTTQWIIGYFITS